MKTKPKTRKYKSPLVNPKAQPAIQKVMPSPVVTRKPEQVIEQKENKESLVNELVEQKLGDLPQMELDVDKVSLDRLISDTKYKLLSHQMEIELLPFWKSFSCILAMTTSAVFVIILVIGGIIKFNSLPPEVPLYYDQSINTWHVTEKSSIFFFALLYAVANIAIVRLVFEVYKFDRRLSNVCNWIIVFINLISYFAIGQIISLR